MKKQLKYTILTAAASLVCISASNGASIVYEGFDYPVGGLNGSNGGTGFAGAWTANGTSNVVADDLTYGSLETTGGSIGNLSGSVNRFGGSRDLGTSLSGAGLLADGSELWFSVTMGYDIGGNRTNSRLGFALGSDSFVNANFNYNIDGGDALGVTLGNFLGNGKIVATQFTGAAGNGFGNNVYGTGQGTEVVQSATTTQVDYAYVVGRITWGVGAADDTIDLFLPGTDLTLGAVHSTLSVNVDQSGYDTISFARGDKVVMDEIRIGSTFADVAPIPEPSSTALLGLGGLALILRRRK